VSVRNRLTAEKLRALAPGDAVIVESGLDFGRPRTITATVVRVDAVNVTVSLPRPRGSRVVERYRLRDGLQAGGGTFAQLVSAPSAGPTVGEQARHAARIQQFFWAWDRNRGDIDALQQLHAAVGDLLARSLG
jgi:hypothetical protein